MDKTLHRVRNDYMTLTEVAKLKCISRQGVHKLIKAGKLKAVKIFGILLIKKSDIIH